MQTLNILYNYTKIVDRYFDWMKWALSVASCHDHIR